MTIQWVFLSTDILLYALLLALLVFIIWVRRDEDLRKKWQHVGKKRVAMVALVILTAFVIVGVLDSLHFIVNHSGEVKSVLDRLLSPLGERYEETFSAPFAHHSFVKGMMLLPSGEMQMGFSPLLYSHPLL